MSSKKKDDKILLSVRNIGDCFRFQGQDLYKSKLLVRNIGDCFLFQGQDLYKSKLVRDNISCAYLRRFDF
ncbi:hypothetical protein L1987_77288 [Smallanthus sonchifolius]|uniref:Uncharacterized protein n=1 Tax=Smallanthus sonchifolius TaxID=185202 RepID=A0ACB8Z9J3_9ASTR|nr:hypothetical protein L1987_77288 [Smallanthus sonchifolius]